MHPADKLGFSGSGLKPFNNKGLQQFVLFVLINLKGKENVQIGDYVVTGQPKARILLREAKETGGDSRAVTRIQSLRNLNVR